MVRNIKILDRKFVPKGTLVIEQGTHGNRAYMVETGKVEVFVTDEKGGKTVLAELGADTVFGEMAVLSGSLRSASVRTIEDSVLVSIPAHELQQSMRGSENIYKRLMRMVSERINDTNKKLLKKEKQVEEMSKAPAAPALSGDELSLKDVALHISPAQQTEFKQEMLPLLGQIKSTLEKFRPANAKKD